MPRAPTAWVSLRNIRTATADSTAVSASRIGIDASPPGQSTPRPSPAQNVPNEQSIPPTRNFSVFSGTRDSGWRTATPTPATTTNGQRGAERRRRERVAALRPQCEDDEDHLEPFEQRCLEAHRGTREVEPGGLRQQPRLALGRAELLLLVAHRQHSGVPEQRLAQPAQAEQQQQRADGRLEVVGVEMRTAMARRSPPRRSGPARRRPPPTATRASRGSPRWRARW